MNEIISNVLMLIGATFLLVAAIGVLRMPDLLTRMQPATKAATMGIACTMSAAVVHFAELSVTTRALAVIAFFFLTAPVTAHLLARASYFVGAPLWEGTVIDELRGRYNPLTHDLDGEPDERRSGGQDGESRGGANGQPDDKSLQHPANDRP